VRDVRAVEPAHIAARGHAEAVAEAADRRRRAVERRDAHARKAVRVVPARREAAPAHERGVLRPRHEGLAVERRCVAAQPPRVERHWHHLSFILFFFFFSWGQKRGKTMDPAWAAIAQGGYDGAAELGRVRATVLAVAGTLGSVALVAAGTRAIRKSNAERETVAVATAPSVCHEAPRAPSAASAPPAPSCATEVSYTARGTGAHTSVLDTDRAYAAGERLAVYYDAASPERASAQRTPRALGPKLIAAAVALALGVWAQFAIVRRNKVAAALSGAVGGARIVGRLFRS
jgi:hypothetical protein